MIRNITRNKVAIVGAGHVGAMAAERILEHDLADVILVDIDEGISKGKACDLRDASPVMGYEKEITPASDYALIKDSHIVVITAGFARKPGMAREDLIVKNSAVVKGVVEKVKEYAPNAIIITVTNPLDVMCYLANKVSGFDRNRVFGLSGALDSARCSNLIAEELGIMRTEVDTIVIGSHDTNMVPLLSQSKAQGKPVKELLSQAKQDYIVERTKKRGAEIVGYLKTGSAFFAPSAACFSMIKAILNNELVTLPVSSYLDGEYGLKDLCIGVPAVLGKNGIEKIVELELASDESEKLKKSAEIVKGLLTKLSI